MIEDMDYEIYQYINQQAENYIPLKKLLAQQNLTYHTGKQKAFAFKENYVQLLRKYRISNQNIVILCNDLINQIHQFPKNQELQYLYFCTITDTGLLNQINAEGQTEEQIIQNYIRQQERIQELTDFMQEQVKCRKKLCLLRENLKKGIPVQNLNCTQEFQLLYELTIQHTFLYGVDKKPIYHDNLQSLLLHLNNDEMLKSVKPYLIFAMLSRKHGMMQNRENFIPNLQTAFQYQKYQIYTDNGKNFNLYQSYLELYDHLRRFYADDSTIDIPFCDFCFANFSPLSDWYYDNCQPDIDIPMNLKQKVKKATSLCFPMLFYYDNYSDYDISEFEAIHPEIFQIWRKTANAELVNQFLELLSRNADISKFIEKLPHSKKYPVFAELFLYQLAEIALYERMMEVSEIIMKI